MAHETPLLLLTAASVGLIHTLLGPDHYVPFIVLAKARNWSLLKSAAITLVCGIGHVGSSVLIGIAGLAAGTAVNSLTGIESVRGALAAWAMIAFGAGYLVWGIRKSIRDRRHAHLHFHVNGTAHCHVHSHTGGHCHLHERKSIRELTPWILFTLFVLGPCEPFIPVLLYPAATGNLTGVIMVILVFTLVTLGTMVALVTLSLLGSGYLPLRQTERYMHPVAGGTILLCGLAIQFLGW